MKKFELIIRGIMILLFLYSLVLWMVDFKERGINLLILILGASGWESILFMLHQAGIIDMNKMWKK